MEASEDLSEGGSGRSPSSSTEVISSVTIAGSGPAERVRVWRTRLAVALGLVWLLDAALQFQPYMFTTDFATDIVAPTGVGSPVWIADPVAWSADLIGKYPVVLNAAFATTQLVIALAILWPRTRRIGLALSVAWALGVWWLGEGMGGIFAGPVSPMMGLPGAALIYAVISVLVWPRDVAEGGSVAEASVLGVNGSRVIWLVLWTGFAVETLVPPNADPSGLSQIASGMADGEPGWIAAINNAAADVLAGRGTPVSYVLAVVFAFIALGIFSRVLARPAVVAVLIVAPIIWVVFEDFGGIFTGSGTDPNSGPLLFLLALCYWPLVGRASESELIGDASWT